MKYRISVAVAPLRREPSDRSEMVSQGLFGEELELFEKQDKWSMIRLCADGYEGWIDNKQFEKESDSESYELVGFPLIRCMFPGGDAIWLPAGASVPVQCFAEEQNGKWSGSCTDIERCARLFMHAPYLWGGRTVMGMDCSGFTQLVMQLNGRSLPRDAYQQAELGTTISFIEETKSGDLAFFDNSEGRIIHVGIVLRLEDGSVHILHASGKVREDALDHQGIYNREIATYTHKLRIIKRVLGE